MLKPYLGIIILLIVFTLFNNAINLLIPNLISKSIDAFSTRKFSFKPLIFQFFLAVVSIFIFSYLQSLIQTYASERAAKDLRSRLADKVLLLDDFTARIDNNTEKKILENTNFRVAPPGLQPTGRVDAIPLLKLKKFFYYKLSGAPVWSPTNGIV